MTSRIALFTLLALLVTGCGSVDPLASYRTDLTRKKLDDLPQITVANLDALMEEHEGQPAYFFDIDRTVEHVFLLPVSNDWSYVDDTRHSYVVIDPDEERYATFRIVLGDREILDGVFLRTTSPSGEVRVFTEADLVRDQDGDRTVLSFAYPAVERGTIIEESYRTSRVARDDYQPPLYLDMPLQREVPVGRLAFRYVFPEYWALKIKAIGPRRVPAYELDRQSYEGRSVVTFNGRNIPGFPDEPFSPYFKEVAPYLEMQVTRIENPFDNLMPLYETPTSWDQLASNFGKYAFDRGSRRRYREVRELAETLTAGLETDSSKVATIVAWGQDEIESGGDADDIAEVIRDRKASGPMKTSLANALLSEAGVDAEYIMIHPVSEGHFDRNFITYNQFTAPALLVTVGGEKTAVFPAIDGLPTTYIPEFFQGADAMVISEDGFERFDTVPSREADTYAVDDHYDVTIDEDGIVRVEETTTLRGIAAYVTRELLADLTDEEMEEEMREMLTYSEGEVEDFTYEVREQDNRAVPLELVLRYTIPDLVTLTPEEVIFRTGGLLSPASLSSFETTPGERQLPIRIYYDRLTNKSITIRYPEGWSLATELADVQEDSRFGDVQGSYQVTDGEIRAEQRIFLKESRATPVAYSALLKLTGSQSKLYVPTLVFSTEAGTR